MYEGRNFRWSLISRTIASKNNNYIRLSDQSSEFVPSHRFDIIQDLSNLPIPVPNLMPSLFLEYSASQLTPFIVEGRYPIIGVPRKGYSILREVAQRMGIPETMYMSADSLTEERIKDSDIVIFDDMIHSGKKLPEIVNEVERFNPNSISAVAIWGSDDGVKSVEEKVPDVDLQVGFSFPEEFFWWFFCVQTSPLLYTLKGGAISNRPFDKITITAEDGKRMDKVASEILESLCTLDQVDSLVENVPMDGKEFDTYHGTLEYRSEVSERYKDELGENIERVEYAKTRVFLHPTQEEFTLHLCGCLCPEGISSDLTPDRVEQMDADLSRKLLDETWVPLEAKLQELGYKVIRQRYNLDQSRIR